VRRALASGTARGLGEAIAKVFETPERLEEARSRLAWLEGFADWVLALERALTYLRGAEAVEDEDVESLHTSLVEWSGRLEEFVEEPRREGFERTFAAYREEYASLYSAAHDAWVGPDRVNRMSDEIVASKSWQVLEAFSALSIADPAYLVDAINLISALREMQCTADVDAALREASVCACGFRFADRARVDAMATRARELVKTGIEFHRRLLQARRAELRDKLIVCKSAYDIDTIRAIAELTKEGPLPPVDSRTIEALNALLGLDEEWLKKADPDQALVSQSKRV
jgi:hypothetical protein